MHLCTHVQYPTISFSFAHSHMGEELLSNRVHTPAAGAAVPLVDVPHVWADAEHLGEHGAAKGAAELLPFVGLKMAGEA